MTQTTTSTITGTRLPEPGAYEIDASHSMAEFVARHLMVTKVRGRFAAFAGRITVADPPEQSSVEVTLDAASIDTGDDKRDDHLRSPDFLDTDTHPTLGFRSTSVEVIDDERLRVSGDLTVRGVTRPVTLDTTFDGTFADPWGNSRIGLSATTEIDREEWGLTWNMALDSGGVVVSRKIRIDLTVSAVKQ